MLYWLSFIAVFLGVLSSGYAADSLRLSHTQLVDLVVDNSHTLLEDKNFKSYVDGDRGGEDVLGADCHWAPHDGKGGLLCVFERRDAANDNFVWLPIRPNELFLSRESLTLSGAAAAFFLRLIGKNEMVYPTERVMSIVLSNRMKFPGLRINDAAGRVDVKTADCREKGETLECRYFTFPDHRLEQLTMPIKEGEVTALIADLPHVRLKGEFLRTLISSAAAIDLLPPGWGNQPRELLASF